MSATEPRVGLYCALAVKKALDDVVLDAFTEKTGIGVTGVYEPTNVLLRLTDDGARPDVMVAVTGSLAALCEAGVLDSSSLRPVASVRVGVATAPDTDPPDLGTVDSLVAALTSARSVAYSRTGASGVHFAGLLDRLGIADQVNARATVIEKGFTAQAIVDGRADLAIQQLSELRFVPQVRVVGPLPAGAQQVTDFSVACGTATGPEAVALSEFLTGELARQAYRDTGLDVPSGRDA